MTNRGSVRPVMLLVVMMVLVALLPACRHDGPVHHDSDPRYLQLDSLMQRIHDVDSLAALVRQSHEQNDAQGEMIALRYQGRLLRNQSRYDEAVKVHEAALAIATHLNDTIEMARVLNNLGTNYRRMGELTQANDYHYKALRLCDAYSSTDSDEALTARVEALNGIGNIEIEFCNYIVADSVLREALDGEKRLGRNVGMAINYGNLGSIKRSQGQHDSAWVYHRKSLEYNKMGGSAIGEALCHLHFGELHEDDRHFSRAVTEYQIAYESLKDLGDDWHWIYSCLALTRVNILLGERDEARRYLTEAEQEARRIGSKEYQAEACMLHYELSLLDGDSQEAMRQYIHGNELQDSIYGLKENDKLRAQRIDYERERSSGELDVLTRDITNLKRMRNMQLAFAALLLVMAAIVIGVLVYAMRLRSRTQRLMRQVEETRSLFFTNVVHQLRSPLSAIMGAIDGINNSDGNAQGENNQENFDVIERQGNNLLMLVDRILQVGSVRSALKDPDWKRGDLVAFVRMIIESYREQCIERHLELTYAPRESGVEVEIVPAYLNTIIGSLIENAISYSREYGKIIVTTRVDGDRFTIRVADDGMGISKEDLPHVFEPFYRSAAAEQIVDGIGIGLTVVRDMTMAMEGTVAVDSMSGQGAVFTVTLPCKHAGGVKQRLEMKVEPVRDRFKNLLKRQAGGESGDQQSASGLPVVLVVEDHNDVARVIGQALSKDYAVHYATDGQQGLAKAGELLPDLIITDVKMPIVDGIEFCRRLRQTASLCHIPVIVLSARTSEYDRIRGIEAGADAYMVKPFSRNELRVWASRLLESRRVMRESLQHSNEQPSASRVTSGDSRQDDLRFLADFAAEVDGQCANGLKIDFDKIAHNLKMGETQLRRRIQTLTGKNVLAYVTQLRMEKAMNLLRNDPDSLIGDIADQCGFQDVAYFSRVFKQHYGMAPSQVRTTMK